MNVFNLRKSLIDDYASYIDSFVTIQDPRIDQHVKREINDGLLWPDPLLQLNPSFEPGDSIAELVARGTLHPTAAHIFRTGKADDKGRDMRLHRHQSDAVHAAQSGDSYVLTTGTGSGKSLAYIVPIVNHVLRRGSGRGIQAVIIYPMNALANSQMGELSKFLEAGFAKSPVTFRCYTGQQSDEEKQDIIDHPPDILLTNYVMLELIMTRPHERDLVQAMSDLQFLVLDELHTYRGRQGADVAMLVRRVRNIAHNSDLQCVGTSATLAEGGTFVEQQKEIAEVASRLFGAPVKPERVIGETLRRITPEQALDTAEFTAALRTNVLHPNSPPSEYQAFVAQPLSIWIESTFGLTHEAETGRLKRALPLSIGGEEGAAARLATQTQLPLEECQQAIQQWFLAGYDVLHPETGFPVFAFRLHQFISRGDTVYASLEGEAERRITVHGQKYVPKERDKALLPLCFCRECGQEYYIVKRFNAEKKAQFQPRELRDQAKEEDQERGFLYRNMANPWPEDPEQMIQAELLPEDWLEQKKSGEWRVKREQRPKIPQKIYLNTLGEEDRNGLAYHFVQSPFPFCLNCGVMYSGRTSDFTKLTDLSSGGRSTATTILSLSALRYLKAETTLEQKAKKLLSFTDNRQDASLQAGHLNDFVEVGLLRAALYRAVAKAGPAGIPHYDLPLRVFEALDLPLDLYAQNPDVRYGARNDVEESLREVLAYRIYQDLKRGWRVNAPNLEQCGLLQITYPHLDEICQNTAEWEKQKCHLALIQATPEERLAICKALLNTLRRELAVKVSYLSPNQQEGIKQRSSQRLIEPWAIGEDEKMEYAPIAFPRSRQANEYRDNTHVSPRSRFGFYLRRPSTLPSYGDKLTQTECGDIIKNLFAMMKVAGTLEIVEENKEGVHGYQLLADAMRWQVGTGEPFRDPVLIPRPSDKQSHVNVFFRDFYQTVASQFRDVKAKEHTAQVPSVEREKREDQFRDATLPILYCSPTMELGVDIAALNVVNMRNVPPTPANYAQRSGRAGRSGQPALVFTYCTVGSPHDQYFFKRPSLMVSGAVRPPRLDLANEDLIRSHVHAVWLAETKAPLHSSLKQLLNLEDGDPPSLFLQESVRQSLDNDHARQRAAVRLQIIFTEMRHELEKGQWFNDEWLGHTLNQVVENFDRACERWRDLYRSAMAQRDTQNAIVRDPSRPDSDKKHAGRLRREAERQIELLTDTSNVSQSDFYSYRYFATENFLPGYNFPRLPLMAYLSASHRTSKRQSAEFLSRPRFLAISEFGPQSIIYHEGARYVINRVILPVGQQNDSDQTIWTQSAQICDKCGYLHPVTTGEAGLDQCQNCGHSLPLALDILFRMQHVDTRRRDRINSDEEERTRMGYELQTSFRFEQHSGRPACTKTVLCAPDGSPFVTLTYGDAATLWRLNKGWRRRKKKENIGFVLDTERGYWQSNEDEQGSDPQDPLSARRQQVVPFVEDRRNCLLIHFEEAYELEVMASLQPALKGGIQVVYQLEDNELAVEPLPTPKERRTILLYESAEGGAGVLRQLVNDPQAFIKIARQALELCHYDPDTLADNRRAPHAQEDCEAACYDCLMSYYNQTDHTYLDRLLIKDILGTIAQIDAATAVSISPTIADRAPHLAQLQQKSESSLETAWLDFLEQHRFALPDEAQKYIPTCETRCDFYYTAQSTAIFVDGPPHDVPDIARRDAVINDCLTYDAGVRVVRFRYDNQAQWLAICAQHPAVFGVGG